MNNIKAIYDNGGKTSDRYTIVLKELWSNHPKLYACIGCNEYPFSPNMGFWQHSGCIPSKQLGKKIHLKDLPKDTRKALKQEFISLTHKQKEATKSPTKRIDWACPDSKTAELFGLGNTGCWTVNLVNPVDGMPNAKAGFTNKEEAETFAEKMFPTLAYNRYTH